MGTIGKPYKKHVFEAPYDTVVVGSGLGGLTTAAMLAKACGQRVLVLERHYVAGGFTHTFSRPGYEWDVGVHYVGEVGAGRPTRRIFDYVTNGKLGWTPMPDVYDRIVTGSRTIDLPAGRDPFRASLVGQFPRDVEAIDRYLAAVASCHRWLTLYMTEKAVPALIAFVFGGLMRWPFLHWARRTTADVLRSITSNQELMDVLTAQWGDYGLPPGESSFGMHAIIVQHYMNGGSFPTGGASQIAETMIPVIEAQGGHVLINAEVSTILVEAGRAVGVRMADGREIRARTVVSDAGVFNTFGRLLAERDRVRVGLDAKLATMGHSKAHVSLYVGIKRQPGEPEFAGTNLWIHDHADDHDAAQARLENGAPGDVTLPFLYISFPSAKDPTFEQRHPGRSTVEVVALVPYRWFEPWVGTSWHKRGAEYDALKARITEQLLAGLEKAIPGIRSRIDTMELSTPLSTQHFTDHPRGQIYGVSSTPARFEARWLSPRTPIAGLYLTGADACLLGVTGALMGGVLTASAVSGRNLVSVASKGAAPQPSSSMPHLAPQAG